MTEPRIDPASDPSAGAGHPAAHPDAPAGGGGTGHFRVARGPAPMGLQDGRRDRCSDSPSALNMPAEACQEAPPGTREMDEDKDSGVRILVERQKDGLYHWLIETLDGAQSCEGVHDPESKFTAEYCEDISSKSIRDELEKQVAVTEQQGKEKPPGQNVRREIIVIKKDDWLTKISRDRWRTFEWERHLKATQETLDRRKDGRLNPDLIYPGDTFEVIETHDR